MWGVREQVALLMSNGHRDAGCYPIARIRDETFLVAAVENRRIATLGVMIQAASATTSMGATRESGDHFKQLIDRLNGD